MSEALSLTLEARDAVVELSAACEAASSACVTVVRQSTQVPNTSKSSALGGVGKAMVTPDITFGEEREGSGVGALRSFWRAAMEGSTKEQASRKEMESESHWVKGNASKKEATEFEVPGPKLIRVRDPGRCPTCEQRLVR